MKDTAETPATSQPNRGLLWVVIVVGVLLLVGFLVVGYVFYSFVSQENGDPPYFTEPEPTTDS